MADINAGTPLRHASYGEVLIGTDTVLNIDLNGTTMPDRVNPGIDQYDGAALSGVSLEGNEQPVDLTIVAKVTKAGMTTTGDLRQQILPAVAAGNTKAVFDVTIGVYDSAAQTNGYTKKYEDCYCTGFVPNNGGNDSEDTVTISLRCLGDITYTPVTPAG